MQLVVIAVGLANLLGQPVAKHLTFDDIIATARDRAEKPFKAPAAVVLPEELRGDKLNYDTYREIHFRHDKALWAKEGLPFRLEFFHPGYLYQMPVSLYEFNSTHVQPIRFVQDFFDYGNLHPKKIPADTGYAGFKLLYALNASNRWDEVASFLGASYFRCLGREQHYGQSARGLALNCGDADGPEEFPAFTSWWLGKPEKQGNTLRLYALLESASCAGAYDFLLKPGEYTVVDVDTVLFFRSGAEAGSLKTIGLAPLTSMYWFGENADRKPDDYRPEVHDSDGLLVRTDTDEFIWSPLQNPTALDHEAMAAQNVRGFGLLQRDRDFADYQDLFNAYERVPSVWIEPRGNWGDGQVHLVQLPTRGEGADNIVTFWNPARRPTPMQAFRFGYTIFWTMDPHVSEAESKFQLAKVAQTRTGVDPGDARKRQFVIDFMPPRTNGKPEAIVRSENGKGAVSDIQVFENPVSKGWRVFFSVKPDAGRRDPVDIECWLQRASDPVSGSTNKTERASEIWRYRWNPPAVK